MTLATRQGDGATAPSPCLVPSVIDRVESDAEGPGEPGSASQAQSFTSKSSVSASVPFTQMATL